MLLDKPEGSLGLQCHQCAIAPRSCLPFLTCSCTSVTNIATQCLDESRSGMRKKQVSEVKPRKADGILDAFLKMLIVLGLKILVVKLIWTARGVGMPLELTLTPESSPCSVYRYFGSYLAKRSLSCSTRRQPDLLFKYSSRTSWNSQADDAKFIALGGLPWYRQWHRIPSATQLIVAQQTFASCSSSETLGVFVLIFKAQICTPGCLNDCQKKTICLKKKLLRGSKTGANSHCPLGHCIIRWSSSVEMIIE